MKKRKIIVLIYIIACGLLFLAFSTTIVPKVVMQLIKHLVVNAPESMIWQNNLRLYINDLLKVLLIYCIAWPIMMLPADISAYKVKKWSTFKLICKVIIPVMCLVYIFIMDFWQWKINIALTCVLIVMTVILSLGKRTANMKIAEESAQTEQQE